MTNQANISTCHGCIPTDVALIDPFNSATFFLIASTLTVVKLSRLLTGNTPLGAGGATGVLEYAPEPDLSANMLELLPVKGSPPPPPLVDGPLDPVYLVAPVYGSTYVFPDP